MKDLSTSYLGMPLKNPVIVGSCGKTATVASIKAMAENNAGAVVLKSLFEEQIAAELASNLSDYQADYPDALDYIQNYTRESALEPYLDLIADAKKTVQIPVIASINCVSAKEWTSFAKSVEKAGADALELNVSLLPSYPAVSCQQNEQHYFALLDSLRSIISIPISLKMSQYSSGLANLITRLSWTKKVQGFVLFNRYFRPDVDIQSVQVSKADLFSNPTEMAEPLRWVGLLSKNVEADFVAATGIYDSEALIKQLLAGAAAVQIVSAIYKQGPECIGAMLQGLEEWMGEKGFSRLAEFQGKLSYDRNQNPAGFERIQFMKQFGGIA